MTLFAVTICRSNSCAFFFSSRRRHTRCALVTGVQTCALPISDEHPVAGIDIQRLHDIARQRCRIVRGVAIDPEINAIVTRQAVGGTQPQKIGRASFRARVCPSVWIAVSAVSLKNNKEKSSYSSEYRR